MNFKSHIQYSAALCKVLLFSFIISPLVMVPQAQGWDLGPIDCPDWDPNCCGDGNLRCDEGGFGPTYAGLFPGGSLGGGIIPGGGVPAPGPTGGGGLLTNYIYNFLNYFYDSALPVGALPSLTSANITYVVNNKIAPGYADPGSPVGLGNPNKGDPSPDATGCTNHVLADLTGNRMVGGQDLGMLLGAWGPSSCAGQPGCPDLNGDGVVNKYDLHMLLSLWGNHGPAGQGDIACVQTIADLNNIQSGQAANGITEYRQSTFINMAGAGAIPSVLDRLYNGNGFGFEHLSLSCEPGPIGLFKELKDGATIVNLKLNDFDLNGLGSIGVLAGRASGNVLLDNIEVRGAQISGWGALGGIIGEVQDSNLTMRNVRFLPRAAGYGELVANHEVCNDQSTTDGYLGGLIGHAHSDVVLAIEQSYAAPKMMVLTGSAPSVKGVGGLVGASRGHLNIDKSFAARDLLGRSFSTQQPLGFSGPVGGLVGLVSGPSSINMSYSSAAVRADTTISGKAGGLIGEISSTEATLFQSYAVGRVEGPPARSGGLVGRLANSTLNAETAKWDTETTLRSSSAGGGTGHSTAQLQNEETFVPAWSGFLNNWIMNGQSYPLIISDFFTVQQQLGMQN